MTFDMKLKELRKAKGITQAEFAREMDISTASVAMWESGQRTPPSDMLIRIARYFNISLDGLLGVNRQSGFIDESEEVITFPVLLGVKAGFGCEIDEIDSGEVQEIPRSILRNRPASEFMVFLVEGDSMSPKFLDGDRVLVSRQTSVDSGDIAIVCYQDFENGTIKKVYYEPGCDFVDLIPLNHKYSPIRIQGSPLEGTRVIGKVVYLFRKI